MRKRRVLAWVRAACTWLRTPRRFTKRPNRICDRRDTSDALDGLIRRRLEIGTHLDPSEALIHHHPDLSHAAMLRMARLLLYGLCNCAESRDIFLGALVESNVIAPSPRCGERHQAIYVERGVQFATFALLKLATDPLLPLVVADVLLDALCERAIAAPTHHRVSNRPALLCDRNDETYQNCAERVAHNAFCRRCALPSGA